MLSMLSTRSTRLSNGVPELNPRSNRSAIGPPPSALFRSIRYLCRPTDELRESYATQAGKAKARLGSIVVGHWWKQGMDAIQL